MRRQRTGRNFIGLLSTLALDLGLLLLGGTGYSLFTEPNWLKVEDVKLRLPRLPGLFSGFRVAQISDIHMGGWMSVERFRRVVEVILAQAPDVLLITGDFLLGHEFTEASWQSLQDLTVALTPLAKSVPTFAVLGNHDNRMNPQAVRAMLSYCGITDLTNTVFTISRKDEKLHLCGVDDVWRGSPRLEDVISQLPDDSAAILLSHEPDYADISAATGRFDLQVSGHTHGGQVVLPFYGPPLLPYLGVKYPSGLYKVGKMFQYTNRGVGMHELAVRWNCPPEITVLTLESPI